MALEEVARMATKAIEVATVDTSSPEDEVAARLARRDAGEPDANRRTKGSDNRAEQRALYWSRR